MIYKKLILRWAILIAVLAGLCYLFGYVKGEIIPTKQTITNPISINNSSQPSTTTQNIYDVLTEVTDQTSPPQLNSDALNSTTINMQQDSDNLPLRYDSSLDNTVIIGDSIALGLSTYKFIDKSKVFAQGGLAARNINDFTFSYSDDLYNAIDMMSLVMPKYIVMSMGMNDVNMTTKDEFIQNYKNNINSIFAASPNSCIMVLSITPIGNTDFTSNYIIDEYNSALKDMIYNSGNTQLIYVDVNTPLKDTQTNSLNTQFQSGDGIHLGPDSYEHFITAIKSAKDWLIKNN